MTFSLHGVAVSRGIAIGRVHIVERSEFEITEVELKDTEVDDEVARLHDAIALAKQQMRSIREKIPSSAATEIAAFIDTHLLMLDDAAFNDEPARLIRERRCNAEWAIKVERDKLVAVFDEMDDAYLKTRRDDVDIVVDRIVRNLTQEQPLRHEVPDRKLKDMIVVARELSPADLVLLEDHGVSGVITEYGGPTSHMAILARSLGIPGVVGLHHARRYIREDELIVLDGEQGVVIGSADSGILEEYRARQAERDRYLAGLRTLRGAPAVTRDGVSIGLQANVELSSDLDAMRDVGAEGIGLYRTEFMFLDQASFPDEEAHFETYRRMIESLDGAPITIRTADLGADKEWGRDDDESEANPALGLRGVRLCLREPALFRPQVRAVVRASALGPVRMMVPMLATLAEVQQVREIVTAVQAEFRKQGVPYDQSMPIGGMIEVPAAAICADIFSRELDFLSIGTNDLIQYTVAIDRGNDEVNYLYDPLNPGVLRLISMTLEAGMKAEIPVAMCGEMAGDVRFTRLLLGLGLTEFSVHPTAFLEIKSMLIDSETSGCRAAATALLNSTDDAERRELLSALNAEDMTRGTTR